jgi:hypothetical protein
MTSEGVNAVRTELSKFVTIVMNVYFHEQDALQWAVRESSGLGSAGFGWWGLWWCASSTVQGELDGATALAGVD